MSEPHVPDPVDVSVGAKIRVRRRWLGMSQTDLARACKVTFQQVQKYERGANRVSASMLVRVAQALEVNPGWFFEDLAPERAAVETDPLAKFALSSGALQVAELYPRLDSEQRLAVRQVLHAFTSGAPSSRLPVEG